MRLALFALNGDRDFGETVAAALDTPLARHEERRFKDGEHKARPLESVRGRNVYVIASLYGDAERSVNDKLVRLALFLGALRDAAAGRVTAVMPYLCYARKDRKTKARDPVTTRYVAALLEAVGTDRVMTLAVHNLAAFQNAFRIRTEHLDTRKLFAEHFAPLAADRDLAVVSPDVGGIKRAEAFREALEARAGRPIGRAFMEKRRSGGEVSGERLVGDVAERAVIIIDDLISGGTTMRRAVAACHAAGAVEIHAAAAHGLFVGDADKLLAEPSLSRLAVTNTVPPFRLDADLVGRKLDVLDAAPLFAAAIRALHEGGSIVELLEV